MLLQHDPPTNPQEYGQAFAVPYFRVGTLLSCAYLP